MEYSRQLDRQTKQQHQLSSQQNSNVWHCSRNQPTSKFKSKNKNKKITSSRYFRAQDIVFYRTSRLQFGSLFQSTNCFSDEKPGVAEVCLCVFGENAGWNSTGEEQEVHFSGQTTKWGGSYSENFLKENIVLIYWELGK